MKSKLALLAIVMAAALTTGCAVNRATATVDPSVHLDRIQAVRVEQLDGEDGTIRKLIQDELRGRGLTVRTDDEPDAPVDATVTYLDRWFWDISMYLLELTVTLREPDSRVPMATGHSLHTSLTRKSPSEMVREVIGNIFKKDVDKS